LFPCVIFGRVRTLPRSVIWRLIYKITVLLSLSRAGVRRSRGLEGVAPLQTLSLLQALSLLEALSLSKCQSVEVKTPNEVATWRRFFFVFPVPAVPPSHGYGATGFGETCPTSVIFLLAVYFYYPEQAEMSVTQSFFRVF